MLLYYIFTRRYPFTGVNTFTILDSIKTREPDLSPFHSPHLRGLLATMLRKDPADRPSIAEVKRSPYFADVDFATVFARDSPFPRLLREQGEETLFSQEMLVRINGQAKRRVVSLRRKPQRAPRQEPLLNNISSFSNIDIKKNVSENTEGFNSENRIESSASLDFPSPSPPKHFLTIGKVGSTALPKYLEILPSTTLSHIGKEVCRLEWGSKENALYEDEPQSLDLKF